MIPMGDKLKWGMKIEQRMIKDEWKDEKSVLST